MFILSCCFLHVRVHGYRRHPLGEILSLCEPPEWLQGLENVTGAYINKGVSREWVKFKFSDNFAFNSIFLSQIYSC